MVLELAAMFGLALLLTALLRGSLSTIHYVGKKILKLAISTCLLYGLWHLLNWKPLWHILSPLGLTRNGSGFRLILLAIIASWISVFWILFSRAKAYKTVVASGSSGVLSPQSQYSALSPPSSSQQQQPVSLKAPELCFSDIGGLEDEKRQIGELVKSRLEPGTYSKSRYCFPELKDIARLSYLSMKSMRCCRKPTLRSDSTTSVVDQFLMEISSLQAENRVFLIDATNRPESVDPRVLRGGRLSEKIKIGVPGSAVRSKLLCKFLGPVQLEPELDTEVMSRLMEGLAPADLKAVCEAANARPS